LTKEGSFTFTRSRCPAPSDLTPRSEWRPAIPREAEGAFPCGSCPSGERTGTRRNRPDRLAESGWRTPGTSSTRIRDRAAHVSECRTGTPEVQPVVRREGVSRARPDRFPRLAHAAQDTMVMACVWVRQPAPRSAIDQHAVRLADGDDFLEVGQDVLHGAGERRVGLKIRREPARDEGHRAGACGPSGGLFRRRRCSRNPQRMRLRPRRTRVIRNGAEVGDVVCKIRSSSSKDDARNRASRLGRLHAREGSIAWQ